MHFMLCLCRKQAQDILIIYVNQRVQARFLLLRKKGFIEEINKSFYLLNIYKHDPCAVFKYYIG